MSDPQLRSSQVVSTYGPGAMLDLPTDSVLVAGLEEWRYDMGNLPIIEEHRLVAKLQRLLNVSELTLRAPPPATDRPQGLRPNVGSWRFPQWFVVQHAVRGGSAFRRRRLVHLNSLEKGRYQDPSDKKTRTVVPVRFVRACRRGHIGDVDWSGFVHGGGGSHEVADTNGAPACIRDLWIEERGTSGDMDAIWITCDCGKQRPMAQAVRRELKALGRCDGARPWLGDNTRESCGEDNRLLIRSASNAYFPELLRVISIPDGRSALDDIVRSLLNAGLAIVDSPEKLTMVRQIPNLAAALDGIPDADVMAALDRVRGGGNAEDQPVKEVEFDALADAKTELGADEPDGDFFARALPEALWQAPWLAGIERVVLVHRLREVVAQVGFTRFEAAGPDVQGELEMGVERAPLALNLSWLPAVENRGEGIFLRFRAEAIEEWLQRPAVKARGRELEIGFARWQVEHASSRREFPRLPYYLLHSFSHLLLSAVSLECGYPASSLRERIYAASPDRCGILLYTGSPDAEGTLGGLVLAGRDLRRHVRRALELGALCSNDPVCAQHSPADPHHQPLLGGACHGCLLTSETSCEQRNDFLDRLLVVPTVEAAGAEFFTATV